MALTTPKQTPKTRHRTGKKDQQTPRDEGMDAPLGSPARILAGIRSGPRLSDEDAEMIRRVVREAREASIGDSLSD
jgi:hypothetical protein